MNRRRLMHPEDQRSDWHMTLCVTQAVVSQIMQKGKISKNDKDNIFKLTSLLWRNAEKQFNVWHEKPNRTADRKISDFIDILNQSDLLTKQALADFFKKHRNIQSIARILTRKTHPIANILKHCPKGKSYEIGEEMDKILGLAEALHYCRKENLFKAPPEKAAINTIPHKEKLRIRKIEI